MALVRVYCGLASADPAARPAPAGSTLTAAVVDDAGRLLEVCEISDDPAGYARLGVLLVERSSGPNGAAIAADSDDHLVTSLLSAAGRPLAITDDDSVDDFAERFADDDSPEEMRSTSARRRAVGLARALQAGALSASALPPPRDLVTYRPVLAAHAALAGGRHAAARTLREVLRELYPAALRAYPDPAEPLPLAVLDALPEPSMLGGAGENGRAISIAVDPVAAHIAADGVADAETVTAAVTALRVAITETSQRAPGNKVFTAAVAETVRQAVSAVRACDAACAALVETLSARTTAPPAVPAQRRTPRRAPEEPTADSSSTTSPPTAVLRPVRPPAQREPMSGGGRRSRPEPVGGSGAPTAPQPMTPPPVAPAPVAPPPVAPAPVSPAAALTTPTPTPTSAPPALSAPRSAPPASSVPRSAPPANRPVSAPPPPPPGITPIPAGKRGGIAPADAGEPFRPTLTTAAINNARAERQRPTVIPPRPRTKSESTPPEQPTGGFSVTDYSIPVPAPRPEPEQEQEQEQAPPGSRANWPLVKPADDHDEAVTERPGYAAERSSGDEPSGNGERRVTPPWLADDLPQEPPMLRLVEPPPLADRALEGLAPQTEPAQPDGPPLRLVERAPAAVERAASSRRAPSESSPPPVGDEPDGDLLIFAAARSAWFTGHDEVPEEDLDWSSTADTGWQAAEQAARPAVGAETKAGLPKRVPQANLVPGSPLREERPLRIVRDAASLAENTTGYFRGWRRGQEIGGFAVGGRPGREAAGGWDFTRDTGDRDDDRDYEYRSAGYRS